MLAERPSARLLIYDANANAVLLLRVNDPHLQARADNRASAVGASTAHSAVGASTAQCWVTPGGGVEPGESFAETAVRELWEETGLVAGRDAVIGDVVRDVRRVIPWGDPAKPSQIVSVERYFAVRLLCDPSAVCDANLVENERAVICEYRWWTADAIRTAITAGSDLFAPADLSDFFPVPVAPPA